MSLQNLGRSLAVGLAVLGGIAVAFATGIASADRQVGAQQAVIISNDITKQVTEVIHAAGVTGFAALPGAGGGGES